MTDNIIKFPPQITPETDISKFMSLEEHFDYFMEASSKGRKWSEEETDAMKTVYFAGILALYRLNIKMESCEEITDEQADSIELCIQNTLFEFIKNQKV